MAISTENTAWTLTRIARFAIAALVAAQWACEGRSPDDPTPVPSKTITGRVVDAIDFVPIVGARLTAQRFAANTQGGGSFSLSLADGVSTVEIEAAGYWKRTTTVTSNGAQDVEINLLPQGKGFDLAFFDYVFRQRGECNPNGLGTVRWLRQPIFEVWLSEFACEATVAEGGCRRLRATGRPAPRAFVDGVRRVLDEDVGPYTGDVLSGSHTLQRDFPAGTSISHPNETIKPGMITIAYVDNQGLSIGAIDHGGELGIFAGHAQIFGSGSSDIAIVGLASHELAHTLGYHHPCGGALVPLPSAMQMAGRPTDADRLHGRILYLRPSNSRSPDIDSNGFVINAAR